MRQILEHIFLAIFTYLDNNAMVDETNQSVEFNYNGKHYVVTVDEK